MKLTQNRELLATLAVVLGAAIGGTPPIIAKIILRELSPFEVTFMRLLLMFIILLPFSYRSLPHMLTHRKPIAILSLLWCGQVYFFIIGIQFTSAIMSQLLTSSVPILILLEGFILHKERIRAYQIVGVGSALVGLVVLTILPHYQGFALSPSEGLSVGLWYGNLLIFLGTFCYSIYLLYIQRIAHHVSTVSITMAGTCIGTLVALVLLIVLEGASGFYRIGTLSQIGWVALIYYATIAGVGMWLLYNWGNKHGQVIVSASATYVSPVVAGVLAVAFLHEQVTWQLLIGGFMMLFGVFLVATYPILHRKKFL